MRTHAIVSVRVNHLQPISPVIIHTFTSADRNSAIDSGTSSCSWSSMPKKKKEERKKERTDSKVKNGKREAVIAQRNMRERHK
jgi:hypothetical protein